jgi:hypothetical protein
MPQRIAVLFVHGVEIRDPKFADAAVHRLHRDFAERANISAHQAAEALVAETVYWKPVLAPHEDRLLAATYHSDARGFYRLLDRLTARVNAGSLAAMAPIALSALARWVPGIRGLDWPTLRWLGTYFVGDAVSYQITPWDRRVYDEVHNRFTKALARLAERAGPDTPLCVISHSLGTVVANDHLWDLQNRTQGEPPAGATPLQRGDTLAFVYTLGSPIALWALRYPDFGTPIIVPSPRLSEYHTNLPAEWINFYNPNDIVAYPLRGLSPDYATQVREDRAVHVGPLLVSRTPLSHPWYWNDDKVIKPIAATLASAWKNLTAASATEPAAAARQSKTAPKSSNQRPIRLTPNQPDGGRPLL